ncbi:DUF4153 domain-containing protein [Rugamonas sp. CCM 8940]|uniref:DUF4153 domain-containing protein n=1 Tax=Rugamonas sp. CCM 8940 TaxID=2765359 RepID=UPI0018F4BD55|nr:DUF4153 domain-containing protein [Rugamonas sp. CCM 8940]MBJ7312338.1 DUF4153 domain-containing protein [Rugamonas sp. CCM 8940]
MEHAATDPNPLKLDAVVSRQVMAARLLAGLLQGALLYPLYLAASNSFWPATQLYLFAPLLLLCLLLPVLLISSLGHMSTRRAWQWVGAMAVVLALLALHDVWRGAGHGGWRDLSRGSGVRSPSPLLFFFSAAFCYVAHSLALAAAQDGRRMASYASHFEAAWKLIIQLAFSTMFVSTMWTVLFLGSSLFMLVKLSFFKELLEQAWFNIPVTCFAFSCAIHLTDVRPAIVRGIRTLLLVLMSWLLPLAALLVTGFLCSLPFTGLEVLWQTRHATAVLLGTDVLLLVLINAAFQNGAAAGAVAPVVRVSARAAAVLLLPLTVIAIYALGLRVGDHGWSADRIIAAACLLVAGCYAIGYAWAAYQSDSWLEPIAFVNVVTAFVILAVLLALFTPLADPARLAVNSQVARLDKGRVSASQFDYDYLRFEGARYGRAALEQLKLRSGGADAELIRESAEAALKRTSRYSRDTPRLLDLADNLHVWPAGAQLPAGFLSEHWSANGLSYMLPSCLNHAGKECDVFVQDMDGDGKPEVLVVGKEPLIGAALLGRGADGKWTLLGSLPQDASGCEPLRRKLLAGEFEVVAPRVRDLQVGGVRVEITPRETPPVTMCKALSKALKAEKK